MRRRYYSQLAPAGVTGVRALIDSASLLWRWRVTTTELGRGLGRPAGDGARFAGETAPPPVRRSSPASIRACCASRETPFVALHAALALAADR